MPSIQLQIRKTDEDFTSKAEQKITDGGSAWYLQKIWFKEIETMDKTNTLFVECSFDSLPESVKEKINKTEKAY